MAHRLKLRVIAEGVETEGQLQFLRRHGCDAFRRYRPSATAGGPDAGTNLNVCN